MAIPTNINSDITKLSNAKTAIKNAIEAKGVTVSNSTALADYITNIGNIPTSSESLTILADIRDALIAIGADIDGNTPYSQYATKIGEITMGATKYLINNGDNGWYTIDDNGFCRMFYKNIPMGSGWTYSHSTTTQNLMDSGTTTTYFYTKTINLPVTFTDIWLSDTIRTYVQDFYTVDSTLLKNPQPTTSTTLFGTTTVSPKHSPSVKIMDSNKGQIIIQVSSNDNTTPTGGTLDFCIEGDIVQSNS